MNEPAMIIPEQTVELLPCPFCGSDAGISEGDGRFFAHCNSVECFCCIGEAYDRDAMPNHIFYDADTAAAAWNKRTPSLVGVQQTDSSVLQNDLRDMLIALGLPDGARPQSPHEVFRECIEAVKALVAEESQS